MIVTRDCFMSTTHGPVQLAEGDPVPDNVAAGEVERLAAHHIITDPEPETARQPRTRKSR